MIVVAGTIDFHDEASRDAAVEASVPHQQATRDKETGCLAYCFAADPCNAVRVQVHELWEDEASLAAHFLHDNYFTMRKVLGSFGLAATNNNKYRCDLAEPVYDETRTARANFLTA